MTNESSANAIIGNTLRIIASGEYHPGAELTQKMASYIIELEQKLADMAVQLANAESKCRELAAESAAKHEFIATCFHAAADGGSMDGADIQELGERLGLFGRETYQPVLHGYICGHEAGEDTVYVMKKTPSTGAFLAEVRASGVDMYADTLDRAADDAERDGFDDGMKFLRAEAEGVKKFAEQLRKGDKS
ncbi:hypothetical protein [Citrobacter portucalensis]